MSGRRFEADSHLEPTFTGYVETTLDALLILEACKQRICPKISRRLHDKERHLVSSGAVFVFQESEAGIKRWTDGLVWSPSRILGNFLIYRELVKRGAMNNKDQGDAGDDQAESTYSMRPLMPSGLAGDVDAASLKRAKERALVGSLTGSAKYKEGGLIKKTISLAGMHMISYYDVNDVLNGKLRTPSSVAEFAILEPSPEFLQIKMFRQPPLIEVGHDGIPRYRAENASAEQLAQGQQNPIPAPVPMMHHQVPMPTPLSVPSMPLPPLPSPPISGGSGGSGSGSAPSSAGGYAAGQQVPNGLLSTSQSGSGPRSRSPLDMDRPGLPRSKSGGSPAARTMPLSGPSARFDPYRQAGRRTEDARPHTSAGEMPQSGSYESDSFPPSRPDSLPFAGHAPVPSFSAAPDSRYAPAYGGNHSYAYPGLYHGGDARGGSPHFMPSALPVPVPSYYHQDPRRPGNYDESGSIFAWQAPGTSQGGRHSGPYAFSMPAKEIPQSRPSSAQQQHSGSPDHVHPQSAPASQTVFSVPSYSASPQPMGLVASSPDDEERWLEQS